MSDALIDGLPEHDGRRLGHVPNEGPPALMAPPIPVMAKSEWREIPLATARHGWPAPIENQGRFGACNLFAAAVSFGIDRWLAGLSYVRLNPWPGYSDLTGGRDVGSNIGEALAYLTERGLPRFETGPQTLVNPRTIADPVRAEAKNFRVEVGYMLPDFDSIMTAVQLGMSGNFSIRVGANFDSSLSDSLGSDGVVGYSRGAGNHAVAFLPSAVKLPGGEWAIDWQNSWGPSWGRKGLARFVRKHVDDQPYFEAYTVLSSVDLAGDATNPPPVIA